MLQDFLDGREYGAVFQAAVRQAERREVDAEVGSDIAHLLDFEPEVIIAVADGKSHLKQGSFREELRSFALQLVHRSVRAMVENEIFRMFEARNEVDRAASEPGGNVVKSFRGNYLHVVHTGRAEFLFAFVVADEDEVIGRGRGDGRVGLVDESSLRNRFVELVEHGLAGQHLDEMFAQQLALLFGLRGVGQQGERPDIHRLDGFEIVAVTDGLLVAAPGEEDIAADDFLGVELAEGRLPLVVNRVAIAVHLIYRVARRIVGGSVFQQLAGVGVFFGEVVVVEDAVFGVVEIGQLHVAADDAQNDVGAVVGRGGHDVLAPAVVGVLIMQAHGLPLGTVNDRMLGDVVAERLEHRRRAVFDFFGILEVESEDFGDHLAHLEEAPQFVELPDRADADVVVALEQLDSFLKLNPIAIDGGIARALLKHHALRAQRLAPQAAKERGVSEFAEFGALRGEILQLVFVDMVFLRLNLQADAGDNVLQPARDALDGCRKENSAKVCLSFSVSRSLLRTIPYSCCDRTKNAGLKHTVIKRLVSQKGTKAKQVLANLGKRFLQYCKEEDLPMWGIRCA